MRGYSSVFKKVLDKFRDEGKLENIHHDFKSKIFESFLKESISKKNWGQFFTPLKVVRAIVQMTDVKEGMKICDPACGVGKFLLEPILKDLTRFYKVDKNKKLVCNLKLVGFDKGFDKDEQKTIILAKANMLIYFSDLIKENPEIKVTEQFSNLFNDTFLLKTNSILGTLSEPINDEYDLILTNPPYVTSGSSNIKEEIIKSGLEGHYPINAMGVEGLFTEWIIRALKPGGKAFVVIPDGILSRTNDKNLRKFILDECFVDAIISLPEKTFFTTIKKTYILAITKKTDKSVAQKEPVFTYLVSEIGETLDVYRFDTGVNDLEDATISFRQFIAAKSHFKADGKKCKTFGIDKFQKNIEQGWVIDKWWTDKEKKELGLIEDNKNIGIDDFAILLGDIADDILSYQEELKELQKKKRKIIEGLSEYNLKDVLMGNIFLFPSIKGLTAKFIQSNTGDIPVYGGRIEETPIGLIKNNLKGVKYFENCLGWNREGSVGYVFWHKHRFSTNDHHRPLIVKPEISSVIDLNYMKYEIQEVLLKQGFRWSKTASKEKVEKISIRIPILPDSNFDLTAQKEIANKYLLIDQIKQEIEKKLKELSKISINI